MSTRSIDATRTPSPARVNRTDALDRNRRDELRAEVARVEPAEADRVAGQVAGDFDRVEVGPERTALSSTGLLRAGARGADVRELQAQLNARGAELDVDGVFGRRTENAVRAFQREQGLRIDGLVGPNTRAAFARTAGEGPAPESAAGPRAPAASPANRPVLLRGHEGPEVEALQRQLNELTGAGLAVDGDFGPRTRAAVEDFQMRAGIQVDGEVGPQTYRALDEVAAGTRELQDPANIEGGLARPTGPRSRQLTVDGNTFNVHDRVRSDLGRRSVPGNRIIAMDSNSVSGQEEILRPLIVIPDDATPAERQAAQEAVDRVAGWLDENLGGDRAATGLVRTTAQNGRGLRGFYHTEFHSVNDSEAVRLIRDNPQEYAQILGETLGQIPGANFIVPHGDPSRWGPDPGAVARDGTSEVDIARHVIQNGFFELPQ